MSLENNFSIKFVLKYTGNLPLMLLLLWYKVILYQIISTEIKNEKLFLSIHCRVQREEGKKLNRKKAENHVKAV